MLSNPQRLAWITMLGALAIFCLLCISTIIFARWLVFESPTELNVTLHVGRGTVGLAEPDTTDEKAVRDRASVGSNNTLSTDNVSQGYLAFADPYSHKIIATATLLNDSTVTLKSASRPRFSLSDKSYTIRLKDREIRLDIDSPLGVTRIGEGG
jgi:hypothetical protein